MEVRVRPPATNERRRARAVLLAPRRWAAPVEWLAPLSAYIAGVPADSDATLYLDGRAADIPPETLRTIVAHACEYLSEGRSFARVVLVEDTADPPDEAERVDDPGELLDRLGLSVSSIPDDPHTLVEHARWAKALVDVIQAEIDKALYRRSRPVDIQSMPLVTVRIATYGSVDMLVQRAIPSVLSGSYQNVEILVCSDGPQPHARAAVEAIEDARVRYLELEQRPAYPSWPEHFWRTAGTDAVNRMLDEAKGAFIAPLDHDDAYTFDHIQALLEALQRTGADFAHADAMNQGSQGEWRLQGPPRAPWSDIHHGTVMWSTRLWHMRYDPDAWLLGEPGDANMWRRTRDTGAELTFVPQPISVHFKERSSIGYQQQILPPDAETVASDILATRARELLTVGSRLLAGRGTATSHI